MTAKDVEDACEHCLVAVDDGVAHLLHSLLHRVAELLKHAVHDGLKRVACGTQQVLVGVGVLLGLLSPLRRQDLDELADADHGAECNVCIVSDLVVACAKALERDADGGQDVRVDGLPQLVDGRDDVVGTVLVTKRAGWRGAGAVGRGAREVLAAVNALDRVAAFHARCGPTGALGVFGSRNKHPRVDKVAMNGGGCRVARLGVHFQAAEKSTNHTVRAPNDCVHHVGGALVGARLVEERVRVDADAHALARVGDVACAALAGDVVDPPRLGVHRIVKELKALLARVVRRGERMAATQAVAVGVGQALHHVARARDRVAGFGVEAGGKVAALRGAVQFPTGDAVALQQPIRIVVHPVEDVAGEQRRHGQVAIATNGAVRGLGQLALVADFKAKGERRLVPRQRALEETRKQLQEWLRALRAALWTEVHLTHRASVEQLVAALLLRHVLALHKP